MFKKKAEKPQIDQMFLNKIQRDFTHMPNPQEERQIRVACLEFVSSGAIDFIFNGIYKDYLEALFNLGETQEVRDQMHANLNVLFKAEDRVREYAHVEQPSEIEDKHSPL